MLTLAVRRPGLGRRLVRNRSTEGFVAVEDGVITAVGRQAELGSRFDGAERLDLPGATVLPGLINGHVHLTFSASPRLVEDYLAEAAAGPCVLTLRAVANLEAAARAGVTTVRDLGTPQRCRLRRTGGGRERDGSPLPG